MVSELPNDPTLMSSSNTSTSLSYASTFLQAAMAPTTTQQFHIPRPSLSNKLDGGNYPMWASYVHDAFEAFNLENYIDSDDLEPPKFVLQPSNNTNPDSQSNSDMQSNPAYLVWKKQDKLILLWLRSTLTDTTANYIINIPSYRQAWTKLENIFKSHSDSKLASKNNPFSDRELIMPIINGLDFRYTSIGTTVKVHLATGFMTVDAVLSLLLDEELHQQAALQHLHSANIAHALLRRPPLGQHRNSTPHAKWNATSNMAQPQLRPTSLHEGCSAINPQRMRKELVTCQICNKRGHSASKCWERFNHSFTSDKPDKIAALLAAPPISSDATWYLDSGASTHSTSDLSKLSVHSPYTGEDRIEVGNGTGPTSGNP